MNIDFITTVERDTKAYDGILQIFCLLVFQTLTFNCCCWHQSYLKQKKKKRKEKNKILLCRRSCQIHQLKENLSLFFLYVLCFFFCVWKN